MSGWGSLHSPVDSVAPLQYDVAMAEIQMTAKERRRALYQRIEGVRQTDPEYFARQSGSPEAIARQAYHSSRIEGCDVDLDSLREAAHRLSRGASSGGGR
jgi:hypothetical protein